MGKKKYFTLCIINLRVFGGQRCDPRTVLEAEWDAKIKTGLFPQTFYYLVESPPPPPRERPAELRREGSIFKHSQWPWLRYFWSLLYSQTSAFDQRLALELNHITKTNRIISTWMLEAFHLQYFRTWSITGK